MDDEDMIRETMAEMLTALGCEVEKARDGREAVELYRMAQLEGRPYDLVIMDLTVPDGMGGRETVRKLLGMNPDVTAVVSSGYSNDPIMSEYRKYVFRGAEETLQARRAPGQPSLPRVMPHRGDGREGPGARGRVSCTRKAFLPVAFHGNARARVDNAAWGGGRGFPEQCMRGRMALSGAPGDGLEVHCHLPRDVSGAVEEQVHHRHSEVIAEGLEDVGGDPAGHAAEGRAVHHQSGSLLGKELRPAQGEDGLAFE
jgi:CheY-like chemotaxis protein